MYFHPPTLDPGPVATLIGFGVLLLLEVTMLDAEGDPVRRPGR